MLSFTLLIPVNAQPSQSVQPWDRPVGPTIADQTQSVYHFETLYQSSIDNQRHYKIQIGIPTRPAPQTGYPVIYLLDGNAALASLDIHDLKTLDALSPPVIVAIDYDTDKRHDVVALAFDYTPPGIRDGFLIENPTVRGRVGGGARLFLNYIETHIKPEVNAHYH